MNANIWLYVRRKCMYTVYTLCIILGFTIYILRIYFLVTKAIFSDIAQTILYRYIL